jgi:hypothetical protein
MSCDILKVTLVTKLKITKTWLTNVALAALYRPRGMEEEVGAPRIYRELSHAVYKVVSLAPRPPLQAREEPCYLFIYRLSGP